jgi:hypothetical protein
MRHPGLPLAQMLRYDDGRLRRWGQRKGEQGLSLPMSAASTARALFEVRCGPKHLSRYFRDASVLVIEVHDQEREAVSLVGKAVVELNKVEAHTPLADEVRACGRVRGGACSKQRVAYCY